MTDAPQDGVNYPVLIGDMTGTVGGDEQDHYHVLQYRFKPDSIDRSQDATLLKTANGGLEAQFASSKTPENKVCFSGKYQPCKEYECILIFDSGTNTFRLERLMGQGIGLKLVRQDQATRSTGKFEIPENAIDPEAAPKLTKPPPRKMMLMEPPVTPTVSMNGATGSSPDGLFDDIGNKRKARTPKATTAPKRPRKVVVPKPPPPTLRDSTDDLLDLVDQIESSVPTDQIKQNETEEEEEEEDFLSEALEADTEYQPSSSPSSSSSTSTSTSAGTITMLTPPPPPPLSRPMFSNPSSHSSMHHHSNHHQQQQQSFGFPSNNNNNNNNQLSFPGQNNGPVPPTNGDGGSSDSGSESESASESESDSESASDSASESESENE